MGDWLTPSPSRYGSGVYRVTQADWERHVANNHIPYRRDCAVCVHGGWAGVMPEWHTQMSTVCQPT